MFVLLKGLSRKKHSPGAPLETVSAASRGISGTWSFVPRDCGLPCSLVAIGQNCPMWSNAHSQWIDRFSCFLRCLFWCVSLTMVLFVTLGPP